MSIGRKLNEIYGDLSHNVTKIYERMNIHLAIDLVYHSPFSFVFDNRYIKKGCVEGIIIGDTRCGKSETSEQILRHYKMGAICSAEILSFAGLVGGLDQLNGRWIVSWGKIPLNHKRMLIIDEVTGLGKENIEKMSQIRSSGIAEIIKIRTEKTSAQARLLWLSNPHKSHTINQFSSGVTVLMDVIGKPEDIARFDFALIVAQGDVDYDVINRPQREYMEHVYNSDLCRDLILWAWSRETDQIIFSDRTVRACYDFAKQMYLKYSSDCPIVNPTEQKIKLARLSASLAARLFSTEDGEDVIVQPEHVEYVYDFLCREYDKKYFGYDIWSNNRKEAVILENEDAVMDIISKFSGRTITQILDTYQISVVSLEEIMGCSRDDAKKYIFTLIKNGALKKIGNHYIKTTGFIEAIKEYMRLAKEIREEHNV